jgi:hypothetical protein
LAEHLIGDALENVVSAFDGFGREIWRAGPVPRVAADEIEKLVTKLVRSTSIWNSQLMTEHSSHACLPRRDGGARDAATGIELRDTARLLVMRVLNAI